MKPMPIGRDNFKDIIKKECYYVDKTKIIEEILQTKAYVSLFPRPRRFGKSLFTSMISYYYDIKEKENYEKLYKESAEAKNKIEDMQEDMAKYKNIENTLNNTLIKKGQINLNYDSFALNATTFVKNVK